MFDIGFGELLLVMVVGLVVLGPKRLPIAVKTVAGWIRVMRTMAASVQNELAQELKLQELQESLKKAEQVGLQDFSPDLKASIDELKQATAALQQPFILTEAEKMTVAPDDAEKRDDEEAHAVRVAESVTKAADPAPAPSLAKEQSETQLAEVTESASQPPENKQ